MILSLDLLLFLKLFEHIQAGLPTEQGFFLPRDQKRAENGKGSGLCTFWDQRESRRSGEMKTPSASHTELMEQGWKQPLHTKAGEGIMDSANNKAENSHYACAR